MPEIREFTSKGTISPQGGGATSLAIGGGQIAASYDRAGNAIEGAARVRGGVMEDIGQKVERFAASQEISKGSAKQAEFLDSLTKQWNETIKNADPNDDNVAERFRTEVLAPGLEQFQDNFGTPQGRQWSDQQTNSMRQHFFEKTAADQSTLAGTAAVLNLKTMASGLSNMVLNDPTTGDLALGTFRANIDAQLAMNPNFTADQATKIRSEVLFSGLNDLARATVVGQAKIDPNAARATLISGKYAEYIDADERKQLESYIDGIERAKVEGAKANEADRLKQAKLAGDTFQTQLYLQGVQKDGTWLPPPNYADQMVNAATANPEGFSRADLQAMTGAANKAIEDTNSRTLISDIPAVYNDFANRLAMPQGDPRRPSRADIYNAYNQGKLSNRTMTSFIQQIDAPSDPAKTQLDKEFNATITSLRSSLTKSNPLMGNIDMVGDQKAYQFEYDARQKLQSMLASGVKPEEAQRQLVDPRSPQYIGNSLPQYQLTTKQSASLLKEWASGKIGAVPAPSLETQRQPGESAADYLKRTGK